MKKALHAFAVEGKVNSGDFFLGPSTKWHFEKNIIKENVEWTEMNIRSPFSLKEAAYVNTFDYFVVGGGGLMLPDSNHNEISCWQWPVYNEALKKITTPLYAIALGYNLFHGQRAGGDDSSSHKTFKRSMESLIEVSKYFSLRHNGDCERLKEIVDDKYHSKIKFEFCPSIEFCKDYIATHDLPSIKREIYAFELKDDRPERRYYKTSRETCYKELAEVIKHLLRRKKNVKILSHDGSWSFKSYLDSCGLRLGLIDNSCSDKKKIISNYLSIDKLFCTAGHSQMMGHALGCDIISLITHDKLRYYLEDAGLYEKNKHVDVNEESVYNKLIKII